MGEDRDEKLKQYIIRHRDKAYALNNWIAIKNKDFTYKEALAAIYDLAGGRETVITGIIDQIKDFDKTRGRSQVYADEITGKPDIVRDENGELTVVGVEVKKTEVEPPTNPKEPRNPKIFRKEDGQVKKPYQKAEKRFGDIGAQVRALYPHADKNFILRAIKAISDYSALKKKRPEIVINSIKRGRYYIDTQTCEIKPVVKESRTIIISERVMNEISEKVHMNDEIFENNIRQFIFDLKNDPINAQPSDMLRLRGLDRNTLIAYLRKYDIITKRDTVSNKDENGNFKKPTVKVAYGEKNDPSDTDFNVRKSKFKLKVKQLYIDLFEKNTPESVNEEACAGGIEGGGDMGTFVQPIFSIYRQKSNYNEDTDKELDETTTSSTVGDFTYDAPAFGDDPSFDRKGGKNHSVSVNFK